MNDPIPAGEKLSRANMIKIALTYPEGLRIGNFTDAGTPFAAETYRVENGMIMAEGDGKGIVINDAVKKALERFDAADTNKDGKLTPEERQAKRGAWRMKVS